MEEEVEENSASPLSRTSTPEPLDERRLIESKGRQRQPWMRRGGLTDEAILVECGGS
jgi:3-methyladenine DNA glycosylase AlkC